MRILKVMRMGETMPIWSIPVVDVAEDRAKTYDHGYENLHNRAVEFALKNEHEIVDWARRKMAPDEIRGLWRDAGTKIIIEDVVKKGRPKKSVETV